MYNAKSMKAEEFICHEEILDTLAYAEANKNNKELLEQIIAKAKLRKGLSIVRLAYCLPARTKSWYRKCLLWLSRLKRTFTATV